jgi:NifU-like protein involved in Fe-S cluster formation
MDEAVIKYYRKLLRSDFEHCGSLENPTIFLDSVGEKIQICSQAGNNYIHLYVNIHHNVIEDIKYLCTCEPVANVAVEILCILAKGKKPATVECFSEEDFYQVLGCCSEELGKKARGLLELLRTGIKRYRQTSPVPGSIAGN